MSDAKLVMIVDDDRDLRETLGDLLNFEGYRTVLCDDGTTALAHLREAPERPDLILLDLMMPLMSGREFRKRQLEEPPIADVPVVVMTASRNVEGIEANEIVYKPPDLEELFEVIRRHASAGDPR
jgi:CheY-like chemotaxis protein